MESSVCSFQFKCDTQNKHSLACCRSYEDEPEFVAAEPCTCLDGETSSVACCVNNFMPDHIGGVLFDEIPAEDVVASIMALIPGYVTKIMTEPGNAAFTKYNDKDKVAKWNWVAQVRSCRHKCRSAEWS